jgi:hypothetical protein
VSVSLIRRPKLPGLGISATRRKADADQRPLRVDTSSTTNSRGR